MNNKLHMREFKTIVHALDEEEVTAACKIMAKEHPDVMLKELANYIDNLSTKMGLITSLIKAGEEDD